MTIAGIVTYVWTAGVLAQAESSEEKIQDLGQVDYALSKIFPISVFAILCFLLGLWLAKHLWAGYARRLKEAHAEHTHLAVGLNKIVDGQSDLLGQVHKHLSEERLSWQKRVASTQKEVSSLSASLQEKSQYAAQLQTDLDKSYSELGALEVSLTALKEDKEKQVQTLESELQSKSNIPDPEYQKQLLQKEAQIGKLDEQIKTGEEKISQLEQKLNDCRGIQIRADDLKAVLGKRDEEIESLRVDLDAQRQQMGEQVLAFESKADAQTIELESARTQLTTQQNQIATAREKLVEAENLLNKQNQTIQSLQSEIANRGSEENGREQELEAQVQARTAELNHLRSVLNSKVDLEGRLTYAESQIELREEEIESLRETLSEKKVLEAQLGEMEGQMTARNAELRILRGELDAKGELNRRIGELEATLDVRNGEIERLRSRAADYAEIDELRLALTNRSEERDRLRQEVDQLREEASQFAGMEQIKQQLAERSEQLRRCEEELQAYRERQSDLDSFDELQRAFEEKEEEVSGLRGELRLSRSAADKFEQQVLRLTSSSRHFEGENVREDEQLGFVYQERPNRIDDLTCISGVAEVLENKLHEAGVFRFKQIALWKQNQITHFGELLSFKDRIERDQWINQAADLHREAYGEHLPPQVSIYRKPEKKKTTPKETPDLEIDPAEAAFLGEKVRFDEVLGYIYDEAPPDTDDLQRIHGVATVLEGKLHQLGIYRFKQIAMWSEEEIEEIGERLAFKDRVHRDQWVHQAIDLHAEKYGEHLAARVSLFHKG